MRDPWFSNAEAEARAGKPRLKPTREPRWLILPSVADPERPTVAELNAGIEIPVATKSGTWFIEDPNKPEVDQ